MDNQIKIMEPNANFRWKNKKIFRGHMVAGYACGMDFSPDMSYLTSGDADGRLIGVGCPDALIEVRTGQTTDVDVTMIRTVR